ncbi:DUF4279 domain-containing protein [Evansella clarkii]|uniref:DUF4279 domain-containing protein n=1 Tax=Evansella clarkii TaxID=79879 RepID=UPI0014320098|nr:DUF4279 domain-containing protein [Evansella clarkii]
MNNKTSIEVYIEFVKLEPGLDFSLTTVTDKQYRFTSWKYSTGLVETLDFEMLMEQIVDTFKDKSNIIKELKNELGLGTVIRVVTYVVEGRSPGYSFPVDVMKFAVSIDTLIENRRLCLWVC